MLVKLDRCGGWRMVSVACILVTMSCVAGEPSQSKNKRHPDFSGVWGQYLEPGKTGFGMPRPVLPLTPEGEKKVATYRALFGANPDSPGAHCVGSGMPESMMFSGGYPMEIVQRSDLIVLIYEAHTEVRHIYFGEHVLAPEDRAPDRNGYSAGHWEGDTLVVETTALKEQEDEGYPHSDQAVIEERYHLATAVKGASVLIDDWELRDSVFYTKPVTGQKKWTLDPKGILLPYECSEQAWLDYLDALKNGKAKAPAYQ
jgi:hypothetical protein